MGATDIQLFIDSKLIANWFDGFFEARDERLEAYPDILRNCAQ